MSESIFRSLKNLSYKEKRLSSKNPNSFWKTIEGKLLIIHLVVMLLCLISAGVYYLSRMDLFKILSLIFFLASYLSYTLSPFVSIIKHRQQIAYILGNPIATFFDAAKDKSKLRSRYISFLKTKPQNDLKLALLHLKEGRSALQRRISSLVGNINGFGLFPGLVTLAISFSQFDNIKYDWIFAVAASISILYFFAFAINLVIMKQDAYISILEFIIEDLDNSK